MNLALLAGLLAFGAASVWGLLGMRQNLRIATDEYSELRTIEKVTVRAGSARMMLMGRDLPDRSGVRRELAIAIKDLEQFSARQLTPGDDEPEEHDVREKQGADTAVAGLKTVLTQLDSPAKLDATRAAQDIENVVQKLGALAVEMDSLIKYAQREARHDLQLSILLIITLTAAIIGVAVAVSFSQYRGVMTPLRRLREGVQRVAAAKFSERLEPRGDEEFVSLAKDFNQMASELDDFYRRLEEKVEAKSKELARSERLASVGYLAAGVAHEINNPLGIISGHAELAMRRLSRATDAASVEKTRQALQIIWDEAFRCKEITEKLLSLAKPGKATRETLSLARVARDTAMLVSALSHYRDRRLVVRLAGDPMLVEANATEMRQVLLNLVINALDATEPVIGEVVIEGGRDNGHVELSVSDNGRGMSHETLERVFEPFYTEKRGASAPGTGLGLSITHAIVESHGGQVRAHSQGPGQGSRFVVSLPATASNPSAPAREKQEIAS